MLLTERISKCISHFLQILVVAETMPFIGGSKNIAAYTKFLIMPCGYIFFHSSSNYWLAFWKEPSYFAVVFLCFIYVVKYSTVVDLNNVCNLFENFLRSNLLLCDVILINLSSSFVIL